MDSNNPQIARIHDLFSLVISFAQDYTSNLTNDQKKYDYVIPFYLYMRGGSLYENGQGSFVGGTNFNIYQNSFPLAMMDINDSLEDSGEDLENGLRDELIAERYVASATVGDGSISMPARTLKHRPVQGMALYGSSRYRIYLGCHGWGTSGGMAYRSINRELLEKDEFILSCHTQLSFKKFVWMAITKLALPARLASRRMQKTFVFRVGRMVLSTTMSWLNHVHGAYFPQTWYERDFAKMTRCEFDSFLQGMIGTDGGIVTDNERYEIYQSNKRWCNALADAMRSRYGINPTVRTRPARSVRSRASSKIFLSVADSERIFLHMSYCDYIRADQHLVLLLLRMVHHVSTADLPNKGNIRAFLKDLGKYIRRENPS